MIHGEGKVKEYFIKLTNEEISFGKFVELLNQDALKSMLEDGKMLDFLEQKMTPAEDYCEFYFAGLRNGNNDASSFQVESNPNVFPTTNGRTLRDAIRAVMLSAKTEA